jgi:hypothetical protein
MTPRYQEQARRNNQMEPTRLTVRAITSPRRAAHSQRLGHEVGYLSVLHQQQSRDGRGILNAIVPCASNADGLHVESARTATSFGLTDRQSAARSSRTAIA